MCRPRWSRSCCRCAASEEATATATVNSEATVVSNVRRPRRRRRCCGRSCCRCRCDVDAEAAVVADVTSTLEPPSLPTMWRPGRSPCRDRCRLATVVVSALMCLLPLKTAPWMQRNNAAGAVDARVNGQNRQGEARVLIRVRRIMPLMKWVRTLIHI